MPITAVKQAVILAGGLGTRMLPMTRTVPKPMIPILGKPFLSYLIECLAKNRVKRVLILVGYRHEQIASYFGGGARFGLSITYSYSPVEADTGTRLVHALPLLEQTFLLLYGDNYWPLHLDELTKQYASARRSALVTVYRDVTGSMRNNIQVDEHGMVTRYDKSRRAEDLNGVDIGFFLLDKRVLVNLPHDNFSFEGVVVPRLISRRQLAAFVTHHTYYSMSTPERIPRIEAYFRPRKVVFLDRDGVINVRPRAGEYIRDWSEFTFLPRTKDALLTLTNKGYELYIVSNQAGIARGNVTQEQVDAIHSNMRQELLGVGVTIGGVFICGHGWDEGCFCRKPNPGLLFQAASTHDIDLYTSYCIGDDARDIQAGKRAGCKTILVGGRRDLFEATKRL